MSRFYFSNLGPPKKTEIVLALYLMVAGPLFAEMDLKQVAAALASKIHKQGSVKVAVLTLPHHDNHLSDGPLEISEKLACALATNKKIVVVERHKLNQVLQEMHLAESGMIDPQTTKSIGQALGADVIVTGTLINLPNDKCEVNTRALLANSGRIIAAERTLIDRTWSDRRSLN